jgi:hypothetical protein
VAARRDLIVDGVGTTPRCPNTIARLVEASLKAALFAASGASINENKSGRMSVWALSIEKLEMLCDEPKPFIVITAPSATNSNLRAQEGIFTLAKHIKADPSPIDRRPFDQILQKTFENHNLKSPGPWFHRVTLPQSQAEQLCFDLALEGINQATLFPDFYGVVKAMKDTARWYRANDGPGKKRLEYLKSFTISYESTMSAADVFGQRRKQSHE